MLMILCKNTCALLHVISLIDWPKHVQCRSRGCLERSGDRKPTVGLTVGLGTTVTLCQMWEIWSRLLGFNYAAKDFASQAEQPEAECLANGLDVDRFFLG